ncbi:MAG: hypothetical protein AABN34_16475 [Acidobacteriota bacterium]
MDEADDSKPTEPSQLKSHRSFGDHLKAIAPYSVLATCLGVGATLASVVWSASNASLTAEVGKAKDEVKTVTAALAECRGESPPRGQGTEGNAERQPRNLTTTDKNATRVIVSVTPGDTATIFGDELRISLIGIGFESKPSRYRVSALVSSPGHDEMRITNADVGFSASYKAKFEIQLMEVDALFAKFQVTRK